MTLRQKTLLIIGVTLSGLLITLYQSLSAIWLKGFAKIELQQTHQNVKRVVGALTNDLMELDSTTVDWATWDETYNFVEDANQDYIKENLQDEAIANLRLNVMLFTDTTGRIVYGKGLNLQQETAAPVPESLKRYLSTNPGILEKITVDSSLSGIVVLPESSLLVASRPILNNDRTAPTRGALTFGRFLNEAEIKKFSKLTSLQLSVYSLQDKLLPSDCQAAIIRLRQGVSPSQTPIVVSPLSTGRIAGYTILKDIQGHSGLLLRVDTPRDIYLQGQQGLRYLLAALLVVGLLFGLVTLLLLEKSVLLPLSRFTIAVSSIRTSGDLSGRLLTSGQDELSHLARAINQLLATLQHSQEQLYQTQEKYRCVVDNATEVIFQTDLNGLWTFLNPAWTEITGFDLKASLGTPCYKLIHPQDQLKHSEQFEQLVEGQTQDACYEIRYQTQAGNYRWVEVNSRCTINAEGVIDGTTGTLNNITDRKQAEARERTKAKELKKTLQQLTQTQAQLLQSEKMSSLGQLLAGVAHEIKNPINFVSGNIDYASRYVQDLINIINCYQQHYPNTPNAIDEEMEAIDFQFLVDDLPKVLNSMKLGAERICEIVQSLRNFSRLSEIEVQLIDIHEGLESTLLILQHQLKANGEYRAIELIKEYGNLPSVECYPGQINQVLMNLLANAIDALEERRLNKGSETVTLAPQIRIRTEVKESNSPDGNGGASSIVIRIADNGPGMAEVVRRHLFKPFFTTKPISKGTGLGLSISHSIVVEKHHGQLLVKSEPGQGTEFSMELPLRQSHILLEVNHPQQQE
ncbi:CHASE4 domain-containing protein [Lyngbya aestuarii]|uniref:CHASE4 domain-containing protein n=1 Tax=Lyngbya aestuarii TaxID=118322 RepID=UPI00403D9957